MVLMPAIIGDLKICLELLIRQTYNNHGKEDRKGPGIV